ncbi:MAG: prepilin-type N-terminal cleavage/methylation domain-containing protein [Nitrospirae bacterium]|nr:MAG: prepilin-type N-terminal cleavage/methylation domain-containing protein [Nitrospirota bacterium]
MNKRGFTLIELLLALAISSVMLVVLAASMLMGYRSEEKASKRQEEAQTLRIVSERLTHLLRGTYPFRRVVENKPTLYFSGDNESLSFVTSSVSSNSTGIVDAPGLKGIRLFYKGDKLLMQEYLFFSDSLLEPEDDEGVVMLENVKDLKFSYLDTSESEKGQWVDEWLPDEKTLPSAVKIEITIETEDKELRVPPLIIKIEPRERVT